MRLYLICTSILIISGFSLPKKQEVLNIPYSKYSITIDGKLNDWRRFLSVYFTDTLEKLNPVPNRPLMAFFDGSFNYSLTMAPLSKNEVEVWMCWDLVNLYFAFQVNDRHLFSQAGHGDKYPDIHLNDGIEIYIDTRVDSDLKMDINDYQFSVDVAGNSIVLRGDKELMEKDDLAVPKTTGQNIYYQYYVSLDGSLNDEAEDKGYIVEMAIPFAAIGLKSETGLKIKLDLCCNDMDHSLEGITTYEEKAKRYWPFNMSGYSDFGYPETWVDAVLAGNPGRFDAFTGPIHRRWFRIYMSVLGATLFIILLLGVRMKKLKQIPARVSMMPSKVLLVEKQPYTEKSELSLNEQLLKKGTHFISDNHSEEIHSEQLAANLGVSLRKLQRITKEEINTTPTNFIYMVKLSLAAEYLKNHQGNVSETAYEFGFSDPGYFSRLFNKHFGMSPADYLKRINK
jgi:AraC-like DNA-binding protein